eukprot:CAMPEP_0176025650 /NCGR_PEP_ID=MMETSP0120_2-20121206/12552_1 /TAXON_ID=160619 /ORGANISM="Kryptoperidinium foliaceum, Strain CCMP 1326" /LENGTH=509 /DNA_ID=CAMNT_0017358837 /DNA_START=95 /DNA_END=1624 /DNA_ORIENTATION=-
MPSVRRYGLFWVASAFAAILCSQPKIVAGEASTVACGQLMQDVHSSLSRSSPLIPDDICVPNRGVEDVQSAIQDFSSSDGETAWKFLTGIARSETFLNEYWQKKPFLIRAKDNGGWSKSCFTVERDLRLMDNSYITGYKTAEILRNGTKTDTWALAPLKENPAQRTAWSDVEDALNGGTIYFNTAGSLWRNLGGLCRMTGYAFGLPPNVNVYCTPPGCPLSVPLHTDKQDVFVFQSQGAKRWRVFNPPPRSKGKDPLARGKNGDVLSIEELGEPLIDTVVQPGDILYVPEGFPHTTDTINPVDGADKSAFNEASIHLTMGLDANVWCLTLAHMRWSLLQRLNKPFNADLTDDEVYWKAMGSVPVGFLGGKAWRSTIQSINEGKGVGSEFQQVVSDQLKDVLVSMEPSRWANTNGDGAEELPSHAEMNQVVDFFVEKHWRSLMETQEELFKDVDARKEETLLRAFRGTQDQNQIMEDFGEFSNNKAFAESFRSRRLMNEQRAQMAMKQGS